jgi:hypothetical protein
MQQQPVSTIKALTVLHFSLLVGQVVFAAIAYYVRYSGTMPTTDFGANGKFIAIGIGAAGLLLSVFAFSMYKKKVEAIKTNAASLKDKLNAYRAANIIRWAMLEAPVLLAIIIFMLSGDYNLLILVGAILLLFITTRPTVSKAAAELSISEDEVNS